MTITEKQIEEMTATELLSESTFDAIFDTTDEITKTRRLIALQERADFLGCGKAARSLISAYRAEENKMFEQLPQRKIDFPIEYDRQGKIRRTVNNFERIIQNDPYFAGLQYNLMSNTMELVEDGRARLWTDADDGLAISYIEREYKIYSPQMCLMALANVAHTRSYHPIKQLIEAVTWDGTHRIEQFLCYALKCEDDPYTREVSRLIFAGGIHRIYNPGCKFDSVPVLIGKSQGEGKSTAVRMLALEDRFYSDTFTIEGKDGMEMITGKWICELSELLALTKAKEVEAVKAFLTRQSDYVRRSYDKRPADYLRQNIFIGTTNREQFLTDKTGNRRFLPVTVHSNGYELHNREQEIRAYIRQCWAEAKVLFDRDELPAVPNYALLSQIESAQRNAAEEDYRVGLIEDYLYGRDEICILELWKEALMNEYAKPTRKDSNDIALIMQSFPEWERAGSKRFTGYGKQQFWKRKWN